MSKTAAIILLWIAVAAVALGAYFLIFPRIYQIQLEEAGKSMAATGRLLQEMDFSEQNKLRNRLSEVSSRPALQALLARTLGDERPTDEWLTSLRAEIAGIATSMREASVQDLFVLDFRGMGLARNIDMHWTGKAPSEDPKVVELIASALQSAAPMSRFFVVGKTLIWVVAVPVVCSGRVCGGVYATFPLDNSLCKRRVGDLGVEFDFAYVLKDGVVASTLTESNVGELQAFLSGRQEILNDLISGKTRTYSFGNKKQFQASVTASNSIGSKGQLAIVVLREMDALWKPFNETAVYLFSGCGVLLVLLMVLTVVFGGGLGRAMKRLEKEAMEVAGGERRPFSDSGPKLFRSVVSLLNQIRGVGGVEPPGLVPEDADVVSSLIGKPESKANQPAAIEEKQDKVVDNNAIGSLAPDSSDDDQDQQTVVAPQIGIQASVFNQAAAAPESMPEPQPEPAKLTLDIKPEEAPAVSVPEVPVPTAKFVLDGELTSSAEMVPPPIAASTAIAEPLPPPPALPEQSLQAPFLDVTKEAARLTTDLLEKESDDTTAQGPKPVDFKMSDSKPGFSAGRTIPATYPPKTMEETKDQDVTAELDDETYWKAIYMAFTEAKEQVGENIEKLSFDRFRQKLEKQADALKVKHSCRAVRFEVVIRNKQVTLRPRLFK